MIYAVVVTTVAAVLFAVTAYRALGVKNQADFLVAGRTLRWPVLVFTLLSSWIGAGSLFAGAENAYRHGFAALWQPAGGWVGLIVIFFVAGRARRFGQFTVPDLLEARYNAVARVMATIAIVISYTMITSYQFKAGGDIVHLIFPSVDRLTGMYWIAGLVVVFTAAAGMASIAYLDLIIGGMVTIIVLFAVPAVIHGAGGWTGMKAALPPTHFAVFGSLTPAQALGYLLPTMLLLVGNQGMYQKFFSASSEKDARNAVVGWIVGTMVLETLLVTLAVAGSARFDVPNPREIIPYTAREGLPALAGALLLGGIFAKVISTANNYLFSPATNLIHDVYARFIHKRASERSSLIASRVIVVLLGVFALLQATQFESILAASLYAYTVYGAAVTPVVLAVFFWRRTTTAGAVSSIVLGTGMTVAWRLMGYDLDYAVYPALGISLIALIGVSLMTKPPEESKWRPFFTTEG